MDLAAPKTLAGGLVEVSDPVMFCSGWPRISPNPTASGTLTIGLMDRITDAHTLWQPDRAGRCFVSQVKSQDF